MCSPSPSKQPKTSTRMRNKLPPAATPLRQVMSKSIKKAIVQHGMPSLFFQGYYI